MRSWDRYQKDVNSRAEYEEYKAGPKDQKLYVSAYHPSLKVGSILGYALLCIIPIANLFAAIFDVAPKVFRGVIEFLEKVFNQPLVPERGKD